MFSSRVFNHISFSFLTFWNKDTVFNAQGLRRMESTSWQQKEAPSPTPPSPGPHNTQAPPPTRSPLSGLGIPAQTAASAGAGRLHPGVYLGQSLRFAASPDQPSQHQAKASPPAQATVSLLLPLR